jgi:RHS repeat-associated protein
MVTFDHNADGTLSKLTLPDSRFVQYGYTNGRLTTVTDLRGNPYTYGYDNQGRLESETDQNTHRLVFNVYGPDGRISQQTDANNNTTQFAWDAATQTATVTDARQHQWKSVFSGTLLLSQTDPFGNKVRYGYEDSTGDLVQYIDALGHVEQMTYDSRHNMLTRTAPAPLSYNEVWTYNQFNDPLTYTDGRGNETDYTYDTAGNLKTVLGPDPDGAGPLGRPLTTYTLDPGGTGVVTAVQDPRLKTTQYGYDPTTHLRTSITTPMSDVTTFTYDATGRLGTSVEPRGNVSGCNCASQYTTTYEYDNADHLKKITSPDPDGGGSQVAFSKQWLYDPAGNLQTYTDENGNATDYGYDPGNRLTSVTAPDPDGAGPLQRPVNSYTYDEVGDLKTRTFAGTHTTTYSYDNANRLASVTSPTGQLWTYGYDANGNRTSQIDANGNATQTAGDGTTTYGYDELGRLKSVSYSDSTPAVTYQYDANDNLTQMTDGSGTETRTYDAVNELTSVTRGSTTFAYVYDIAGNLSQTTYPDSTVVSAAFDNDERLSSVTSGGVTTTYGYDPASNLTTMTLPSGNGFVETRTYDRAGRLTEVKNAKGATTLSDITYTLDSAGNPTKAVRTGGLAETTTLTYDNLNRITSVCYQLSCPNGSDPFVKWTYDGVGNRLTEQRPTGTKNYTYNNADQLTQVGTTAYTYDQNGNEKTAGATTFSYDLANRLVSTTTGSTTTTYTYDGLNKRLQASTGSQANKKTNFLWDIASGLPQVALERDGNNGLLRRYIFGRRRISMTSGNNTYYFHYDPLGSVTNMTSSAGATEWTDSYEPYGPVRTEVKNDSHGAPTTFMKYAGEYLDPTGLYHLRARQYDPSTGRFLTLDPLPNPTSDPYMSAYSYANDRPALLTDPSGMRSGTCGSWKCFGAHIVHSATCVVKHHPVEAVVGGVLVVAGGGYVFLGVGVATGAIAAGEGSTALAAAEAEFGAEHSGWLIAAGGAGGAGTGGWLLHSAGC